MESMKVGGLEKGPADAGPFDQSEVRMTAPSELGAKLIRSCRH